MNYGDALTASRIKKLNNADYIKFKLWATYSALMILFVCLGAFLHYILGDRNLLIITERIQSVWLSTETAKSFVDFFIIIIYNSVDIFKISFIILIAGFTYISDVIAKISTVFLGICVGFSLCYCIDTMIIRCDATIKIAFLIAAIILCSVVFVSNCVYSVLTAQKFSEYRNVNVLLTSELFWRYIGKFLVSFGYIQIIYIAYKLILKILC